MMSVSDPSDHVSLGIRAADEATEIFVVDSESKLAGRGVGHLELSLEPGVYLVKVLSGFEVQKQEYVALRPGSPPIIKEYHAEELQFTSSAPLIHTAKTHEIHQQAASRECDQVHSHVGQGSWIYIFIRDLDDSQPQSPLSHPAEGLTLHDLAGNIIADFSTSSQNELGQSPWVAYNVALNPGPYRFHLKLLSGQRVEQTIIASPGWQTQVYMLLRAYDPTDPQRRADLPSAAIFYSPDHRFSPDDPELRLAELARLALARGRKVLSEELRQMLRVKLRNPMLGIFGAHLLLDDHKPDVDLFQAVVENLRSLLGRQHPDVEALALRLPQPSSDYVFNAPPMLRRSWSLVLGATIHQPHLVPPDSLAAQVAGRLWSDGPWLLWTGATGELKEDNVGVAASLKAQLRLLKQAKQIASAEDEGREAAPAAVEAGTSMAEVAPADISPIGEAVQAMVATSEEEKTIEGLVHTLRLPRSTIEALMASQNQKKKKSH
jgi:hypothetical protein